MPNVVDAVMKRIASDKDQQHNHGKGERAAPAPHAGDQVHDLIGVIGEHQKAREGQCSTSSHSCGLISHLCVPTRPRVRAVTEVSRGPTCSWTRPCLPAASLLECAPVSDVIGTLRKLLCRSRSCRSWRLTGSLKTLPEQRFARAISFERF